MHVCYRVQQNQVGKDSNNVFDLYEFLEFLIMY
jgi:hypothetical protein